MNLNYAFIILSEAISNAGEASANAQETISKMMADFWARLPYVAVGFVVFLIFLFVASIVKKIISLSFEKAGFDQMVAALLARIGYIASVALGFFIAAAVVFPGLSAGDLIAGLGIGSVALGFAFKDILQNLFAGFLILLYQPFQIGDQIKVNDFEGTVEDITVRATNIKTYDGERVVIPNNDLFMNSVLVRTAFDSRRSNFVVGIAYGEDIEKARSVILDVVTADEGVLEQPAPTVEVIELADSSVNLKIQYWTKSVQTNVRLARNDLFTAIKYALDKNEINIPFPHLVVIKDR